MITRDYVWIMFPTSEGVTDVAGLMFVGTWTAKLPLHLDLDDFRGRWTSGDIELDVWRWDASEFKSYEIDVRFRSFPEPSEWKNCLRAALAFFIENGAVAAWCGPDAPIISPDAFIEGGQEARSIYAAFTPQLGLAVGAGLEEEFATLSERELQKFRDEFSREGIELPVLSPTTFDES